MEYVVSIKLLQEELLLPLRIRGYEEGDCENGQEKGKQLAPLSELITIKHQAVKIKNIFYHIKIARE
jgi:hypothetical protein